MRKKLILRFPKIDDKEEWLAYYDEFVKENPNSDPLFYSEASNYEDFLIKVGLDECRLYNTNESVPTSHYILVMGDKIIGHASIHHNIEPYVLQKYLGHIGYGIRPSYRNRGYGTRLLKLALKKCHTLSLKRVLLICRDDNIASSKVIENNNGILLEEEFASEENTMIKRYYIDIR